MATSQGTETVTGRPPSNGAKASLAILVAEDNIATQDLLKLMLTQRGHSVDVVDDGAKALNALQNRHYNIALMDFHLPTMDGLRVVATCKVLAGAAAVSTHFIGITADVAGFMEHPDNWETFDLVIAKPIDIVHLCSVVENFEHYMAWRSHKSTHQGASYPTPVILADDGGTEGHGGNGQHCRDKRMKIDRGTTQISLGNGEVHSCRVLNLSLSGAGLELKPRPQIGERVRVGRTEGRVTRHTKEGISVEFGVASA